MKTNIRVVLLLLIILGVSIYVTSSKQPAPRVQQDYKIVEQPKAIGVAQQKEIDADAALALGILNEAGSRLAEERKQWEDAKWLALKKQEDAKRRVQVSSSSYATRDPLNPANFEAIRLCIIARESGGRVSVINGGVEDSVNYSSKSAGLYQFMPGTWKNYGGYSSANQAPAEIQTERFWQVWNNGYGRNNWYYAPRNCW